MRFIRMACLGLACGIVFVSGSSASGRAVRSSFPIKRIGTFSVRLRRHGTTVGRFTCKLRIVQFRKSFKVEAIPESGWLAVPRRGHWQALLAIRAPNIPPAEGVTGLQSPWVPVGPGKVSFRSRSGESYALTMAGRFGNRVACGLLAVKRRDRNTRHPYARLYATVAWPSFKLLGANRPVKPGAPGGGLG